MSRSKKEMRKKELENKVKREGERKKEIREY